MKRERQASNPEIRKILREVEKAPGWRMNRTKSGWKIFAANGTDVVTIHDGSSDRRHTQAIRSDLRKAGLTLTT